MLFVRVPITRRHLSLIFCKFSLNVLFNLGGYDINLYSVIFYNFNSDVELYSITM